MPILPIGVKGNEMKKPAEILKSEKGIKIIFAVGIILIITIFLFSLSDGREEGGSKAADLESNGILFKLDDYERRLEERLSEIVGKIEGTSGISVMITLEKSEENIYEGRSSDISATVTPTVRGVVIVCKGCENAVVRQKVVDAACKALGVSAARVCVTY